MRVFVQSDEGRLLATIEDGDVFLGVGNPDVVAFALFKALMAMTRPVVSVGGFDASPLSDDDVDGGSA